MSKKLLEESTIRQFMKLAQLEPLASDFLEEGRGMKRMEEEEMREEEMREEEMREEEMREELDEDKRKLQGC